MTDPKPPVTHEQASRAVACLHSGDANGGRAIHGYIDQQEAAERSGREALRYANKKCQDYEIEYILPCFKWAEECGIDLRALVREGGGNCVAKFVGALRAKLQDAERRAEEAERENARVMACLADLPPIVKLWLSKPESGRFCMNGAHYQCGG